MTERARKRTWVEVHRIVLDSGNRAPQIPADTQQTPLEMTVKGFLTYDAAIGEEVDILTPSGRILRGALRTINPAYTHTFGAPIPELSGIGDEVRAILKQRRSAP